MTHRLLSMWRVNIFSFCRMESLESLRWVTMRRRIMPTRVRCLLRSSAAAAATAARASRFSFTACVCASASDMSSDSISAAAAQRAASVSSGDSIVSKRSSSDDPSSRSATPAPAAAICAARSFPASATYGARSRSLRVGIKLPRRSTRSRSSDSLALRSLERKAPSQICSRRAIASLTRRRTICSAGERAAARPAAPASRCASLAFSSAASSVTDAHLANAPETFAFISFCTAR
mmetsp:Transcript_13899/g.33288  ORF Transcript_13899/g.33288 Transcript_13899/m.33288 type:complete len:235 (-) Transcript_13899:2376-3080(-)